MRVIGCCATAVWLCLAATTGWGDEPRIETVVDGLDNPCAVALQPGTGHIFVAESGGGRIVRIHEGKVHPVITGFPRLQFGADPSYRIGPLGLAFINQSLLVVGEGGLPGGEDRVSIYKIPQEPDASLSADAAEDSSQLVATEKDQGGGDFHGVAVVGDMVLVTCHDDQRRGWIAKAEVSGGALGALERLIDPYDGSPKPSQNDGSPKPSASQPTLSAPVALTTMPQFDDLVAGYVGRLDAQRDSMLAFYRLPEGQPMLTLPTGLHDLVGLAYSPVTGRLYGVDFAYAAPAEGGLFRLDSTNRSTSQTITAVRIATLDKPTALAFAVDGTLYLTVLGTPAEGSEQPQGKLLQIAPSL